MGENGHGTPSKMHSPVWSWAAVDEMVSTIVAANNGRNVDRNIAAKQQKSLCHWWGGTEAGSYSKFTVNSTGSI